MKRCPSCQKTFEDSKRFCQIDGTPLVDDAPAPDMFKTIVAPSMPAEDPFKTVVGGQQQKGDILDLPDDPADQMKTMIVSQDDAAKNIPSPFGAPQQQNSAFDEPQIKPPMGSSGQAGESSSSSSPFGGSSPVDEPRGPEPPESPFGKPPGSSPFDSPAGSPFDSPGFKSPQSSFEPPAAPSSPFDQPAQPQFNQSPSSPFGASSSPFDQPQPQSPFGHSDPQQPFGQQQSAFGQPNDQFASPQGTPFGQNQQDWAPPPAPVAGWQDQGLGANTPFQTPPVAAGQNSTLATVSLVLGILGICPCGLFAGVPALITGYMAQKNVDADPAQYGGRGLATAGMIMGGISILLSIVGIILQIVLRVH
jgi:Domain of unknown function (DUF4190)